MLINTVSGFKCFFQRINANPSHGTNIQIGTSMRPGAPEVQMFWDFCFLPGKEKLLIIKKPKLHEEAISMFWDVWSMSLLNCLLELKKSVLMPHKLTEILKFWSKSTREGKNIIVQWITMHWPCSHRSSLTVRIEIWQVSRKRVGWIFVSKRVFYDKNDMMCFTCRQ